MKPIIIGLSLGILYAVNVSDAEAALLSRANGTMVYDSDLNITWVADASLFKTQFDQDPTLGNRLINNIGSVVDSDYGSHLLIEDDFRVAQFGLTTWWGAQAWVTNLNYGGFSDWRLPGTASNANSGYNQTTSELGHLFYNELGGSALNPITVAHNENFALFTNIKSAVYWSGNETESNLVVEPYPGYAWNFNTQDGYQNAFHLKDNQFIPWAVRSGDITNVPLPAPIWLLASALLGLFNLKSGCQSSYKSQYAKE